MSDCQDFELSLLKDKCNSFKRCCGVKKRKIKLINGNIIQNDGGGSGGNNRKIK